MASCIYCRRDASQAKGVEHVLPEALGNPDWVLPRGMVCDPCNGRVGRAADMPFVNRGVGALRSVLAVPGKKGVTAWSLPKSMRVELWGDGVEDLLQPGMRPKTMRSARSRFLPPASLGPPRAGGRFEFPLASESVVSKFMSRLLLATVAAHLGREVALADRLDLHRDNLSRGVLPTRMTSPTPDGSLEPSWLVGLVAQGVFLELWKSFRFGIHADGSPVIRGNRGGRLLPIEGGGILQYGGPFAAGRADSLPSEM